MMSKLWKASIVVVAVVLLFSVITPRVMPQILWVILVIIIPTFGISLCISRKISLHRRYGIAYLVFVGFTYLIAGILGVSPQQALVASVLWHFLISPYPLLTLINGCVYSHPCTLAKLPYAILPAEEGRNSFYTAAIIFGSVAIVAAFGMAKNKRAAYGIWLGLVGLSILAALGYVVAEFEKWGMPQYQGPNDPTRTILSLCWAASYVIAYLMARKGVDFRKANSL